MGHEAMRATAFGADISILTALDLAESSTQASAALVSGRSIASREEKI
jgi:hypothetical protein